MEGNNMQRRTWSPKEKLEIILEGIAQGNIAAVCRRRGIQVHLYYEWRDRLFKSADLIFGHTNRNQSQTKIAKLETLLQKKDTVIAEITQENLELKRGRWQ